VAGLTRWAMDANTSHDVHFQEEEEEKNGTCNHFNEMVSSTNRGSV
jgi:hypothetical protein